MGIQNYIESLGGTLPNPSKEAEYDLIRRAQVGTDTEDYDVLLDVDDARVTIARSYFGLVYSRCARLLGIGKGPHRYSDEFVVDALQTGMAGLFKAVMRFNCGMGNRLSTLAVIQIDCDLFVFRKNNNKNKNISAMMGGAACGERSESDTMAWLLYDIATDGRSVEAPESGIHAEDRHRVILDAFRTLDSVERDIVSKRYGVGRESPQAYGSIVEFYGMSLETIRCLNNTALRKIYLYIMEKYGDMSPED